MATADIVWLWIFAVIGGLLVAFIVVGKIIYLNLPPESQARVEDAVKKSKEARENRKLGELNPLLFCPHCQTTGFVRAKPIVQKQGISGAKATGAVLTGGVSMLATGLSRKENRTQAHCDKCGSTWIF
jgi:hypothetical protein